MPAFGTDYFGRITAGSYVSVEKFSSPLDGSARNDFSTISTRFYLKSTNLGSPDWESTLDLRDKNDFFEKLDRERLALTNGNTLQERQVNLAYGNTTQPYHVIAGRFPVTEAGDVNVDGGEAGYHWTPYLRTSLFGGLNPKRPDQSYLQLNRNSDVFGSYISYQPKSPFWDQSFYASGAVVGETVQGHNDRTFVYSNVLYQWDSVNQLLLLAYVDFVPRTFLQTGLFSYHQQLSPIFSTQVGLTAIDVIEYSHRQGVLELLQPSPYREASWNLRTAMGNAAAMDLNLAYGMRIADGLRKREASVGPTFANLANGHFTVQGLIGLRRNFTADEKFFRTSTGYFSNRWEFNLDTEVGTRLEPTGVLYHPMIFGLGVSNYLSKTLYATLSVEEARTEFVNIVSGFFKIGYRFGSKDVPPLRDGAPPKGRL